MYVGENLYAKTLHYVDIDDPDFFSLAVDAAIERYRVDAESDDSQSVNQVKNSTPVVFNSTLSKIDVKTESTIDRKMANDERARRKFIMIDADFDPGEEDDSQALRDKIISVAQEQNTPLLIYPTASYPSKPRFRAVMFVKRALSAENYHQAMTWWFDQLGEEPNDPSDMRMSANRNAPRFSNDDQVEAIYSTLDDEGLELLDNKMWSKYPKPKKARPRSGPVESTGEVAKRLGVTVDADMAVELTRTRLVASGEYNTREGSWRFIESVADAVRTGLLTSNQGEAIMTALADAAPNESVRKKWTEGNINTMHAEVSNLNESPERIAWVKPLMNYRELLGAIVPAD